MNPFERALQLFEKAGMPWCEAEKLALSEAGIDDEKVDELIGNASQSVLVHMLEPDELREFVRSVLVHQYAPFVQKRPGAGE